jgi:hypothetical protein
MLRKMMAAVVGASLASVSLSIADGQGQCNTRCRSADCYVDANGRFWKVDDSDHTACNADFRHDDSLNLVTAGSSFPVSFQRHDIGDFNCAAVGGVPGKAYGCADPLAVWANKTCWEACQMQGTP